MPYDELEELADKARELEKQGDLQGALDCHLKILETYPDDLVLVFNAHGYIADLYMRLERPEDAQRHLELGIALNATDAAYYYALGKAHRMQNDYEGAAKAFAAASRMMPEHPELHRAHGAALLALGRLDEAETAFLAAYHILPQDPATMTGLIAILARRGRLEEAEKLLASAFESAPDDPMLRHTQEALRRLRAGATA